MKLSPLARGALLAAASVPALLAAATAPARADDLDVTVNTTTPISTSQAKNGSAGNVTIEQGVLVSVTSATTASVTLNSNNNIVNDGTIQNLATSNGVGVHLVAGSTGNFTNDGTSTAIINVIGSGAGDYGVLLDGAGVFTGEVDLQAGSVVRVNGDHSTGVAIKSELNGNLSVGTTFTNGVGTVGALTTARIDGSLNITGNISISAVATFTTTDVDPLSGYGVAVGADVNKGIIFAGPATSGDLTTASSVTNVSNLASVAVAPSIGGNVADIVIGAAANDTINPAFSVINRGSIIATENDPGVSTLGLLIGETGVAAHTVTLSGGLYNRGAISAQAQSDNQFATKASAAPTDATALEIGNGAIIQGAATQSPLANEGSIVASVHGNKSTTVTAILIQPGAQITPAPGLVALVNGGTISATASSNDTAITGVNAYGIRDLSGQITTINNAGTISALATGLDDNSQKAIAIDVSHATSGQTIASSGTINGDVVFGSGDSLLKIDTVGNSSTAILAGGVSFTGGTLDVQVSSAGNGGTLRTRNASVTSLEVGSGGSLEFSLSRFTPTDGTPILTATGPVSFAATSHTSTIAASFLPASGTYTLITSAGTLSFDDFAATTGQNVIPFLYNGNLTHDDHTLTVELHRKTAAELGLTGNQARIYEPLAAAALKDDPYGAALLQLTNIGQVEAALNASVPDVAGGMRALAVAFTDQATGVIGARERSLVTAPPNTRDDFRFWAQEFYNAVNQNGSGGVPGFFGAGQGATLGVEWGALRTGRYGLGATFYSSQETESHPRDTKTDGDWQVISAYAAWRANNFFFAPEVNFGRGGFNSRRQVTAGTFSSAVGAHWAGYMGAGGFSTGYIFNVGPVQVIPQIAIDGLYVYHDQYKEVGGSGVGVILKSQHQDSVRSFAGVMAQSTFSYNDGSLMPQILAGWSHEFMNNPATIDGSFESAPGSPFHLVGPTLNSNRMIGGASVAYVFGNWSAGVNYDATESSGALAHAATVNISSRF